MPDHVPGPDLTGPRPLDRWLNELSRVLAPISERPRTLSYEITAWATGRVVSELRLAARGRQVSEEAIDRCLSVAERLASGEPLAYAMGGTWFYGQWFTVKPGVLIPRPDTEILVEQALAHLPPSGSLIVESGVGSGAVLISLILAARDQELDYRGIGCDLSQDALSCAQDNVLRFGLNESIDLIQADLLPDDLKSGEKQCGLLLANLPYIRSPWIDILDENVRQHEPLSALDGGEDGLDLIRRLVELAARAVSNGGWIMLEHDADQGPAVRGLLETAGKWQDIHTTKDYADRPRVTSARMEN